MPRSTRIASPSHRRSRPYLQSQQLTFLGLEFFVADDALVMPDGQLLDPAGVVSAQVDSVPQGGGYPTNWWLPDEIVGRVGLGMAFLCSPICCRVSRVVPVMRKRTAFPIKQIETARPGAHSESPCPVFIYVIDVIVGQAARICGVVLKVRNRFLLMINQIEAATIGSEPDESRSVLMNRCDDVVTQAMGICGIM